MRSEIVSPPIRAQSRLKASIQVPKEIVGEHQQALAPVAKNYHPTGHLGDVVTIQEGHARMQHKHAGQRQPGSSDYHVR